MTNRTKTYSAINILRRDKGRFDRLAGGNKVMYLTALIDRETCQHPEKERTLFIATYRIDNEAINANEADEKNVTLRGFFCTRCRQYIFPKPVM